MHGNMEMTVADGLSFFVPTSDLQAPLYRGLQTKSLAKCLGSDCKLFL